MAQQPRAPSSKDELEFPSLSTSRSAISSPRLFTSRSPERKDPRPSSPVADGLNPQQLLSLALQKKWEELAKIIREKTSINSSTLELRVEEGAHKGRHLLRLLWEEQQWDIVWQILQRLNSAWVLTVPTQLAEKDNFGLILCWAGRWREIEQLTTKPELLPQKLVGHQNRGVNMFWFLAFWGRWREFGALMKLGRLSRADLDSRPKMKDGPGKTVLELLVHHKQSAIILALLDRGILQLEQFSNATLIKIVEAELWDVFSVLIARNYFSGKGVDLTLMEYLYSKNKMDSFQLVLEAAESSMGASAPERANLLLDFAAKDMPISNAQKRAMLQLLIRKGMYREDQITKGLLQQLIENFDWVSFELLIEKGAINQKHLEVEDPLDEEEGNFPASFIEHGQFRLILLLAQRNLLVNLLDLRDYDNNPFLSKLLNLLDHEGDAAQRVENQTLVADILIALVRYRRFDERLLSMRFMATRPNESLLQILCITFYTVYLYPVLYHKFQEAELREQLLPEITARSLLVSVDRNPDDSFLIEILSSDQDRLRFIPALLASPSRPLADIPWQYFSAYTPRLMVLFWLRRLEGPLQHIFKQLCDIAVPQPCDSQLAVFLSPGDQIAWLREGGPPLNFEEVLARHWRLVPSEDRSAIAEWLCKPTDLSWMSDVDADFGRSPTTAALALVLLRYGGPEGYRYVEKQRVAMPAPEQVAPYMSEACVLEWLFNGNWLIFETNYLNGSSRALLPSYRTIQRYAKENDKAEKLARIKRLCQKHLAPPVQTLNFELMSLSPKNEFAYWQGLVADELSLLLQKFYYVKADMFRTMGNVSTITDIIWAYCLDPLMQQASVAEEYRHRIENPHYFADLGFKDSVFDLVAEAKEAGQHLEDQDNQSIRKERSSSAPGLSVLDEDSGGYRVRRDSNSFFHAAFGKLKDGEWVCPDPILKRGVLQRYVFSQYDNLRPIFIELFKEKRLRFSEKHLAELHQQYKNWQKENEKLYSTLESLLEKNSPALTYLQDEWSFAKKDRRGGLKLEEALNNLNKKGSLKAKQYFKGLTYLDAPWNTHIAMIKKFSYKSSQSLMKEYAASLGDAMRPLFFYELELVAEAFNLRIHCYLPHMQRSMVYNDEPEVTETLSLCCDEFGYFSRQAPLLLDASRLAIAPHRFDWPATPAASTSSAVLLETIAGDKKSDQRRKRSREDEVAEDLGQSHKLICLRSSFSSPGLAFLWQYVVEDNLPAASRLLKVEPDLAVKELFDAMKVDVENCCRLLVFIASCSTAGQFEDRVKGVEICVRNKPDIFSQLLRQKQWWLIDYLTENYFVEKNFTALKDILAHAEFMSTLHTAPLSGHVMSIWQTLGEYLSTDRRYHSPFQLNPKIMLHLTRWSCFTACYGLLGTFGKNNIPSFRSLHVLMFNSGSKKYVDDCLENIPPMMPVAESSGLVMDTSQAPVASMASSLPASLWSLPGSLRGGEVVLNPSQDLRYWLGLH